MELQAVLLAGGEGERLYPLTDDYPKALLPVANRPLIYYSLRYLETSGFKQVIVVLNKKVAPSVSNYLNEVYHQQHPGIKIQIEVVNDGTDSADALRSIRDHIQSDFLVMSVDLITDVPILKLVNIHRQHSPAVTMLLKQAPVNTADPMALVEYIGVSNYDASNLNSIKEPHRIAYFPSSHYLTDDVELSQSFLHRFPNVTFSQNLQDGHLYIFSKWVVDVLVAKETISSLKHQLVPYLVMSQRMNKKRDSENIIAGIPQSQIESAQKPAYEMSHSSYNPNDLIPCFAYIVPSSPAQAKNVTPGIFVKRCQSLVSYLEVNRSVAEGEVPPFKIQTDHLKKESHVIVGSDCAVGVGVEYEKDQQTTLKRCNVGNHCKIGKNVKLIESVIMDHVTIGAGCTIKNSIVCANATIGPKISLTNCQVGHSYDLTERGDYKGDTFETDKD